MPHSLFTSVTLDKADIYIATGAFLLGVIILLALLILRKGVSPSMDTLSDLCAIVNTKGGIIILLTLMWIGTLSGTVAICLWAIIHGVDPANATLVVLLSVLTSGAWGNVNGALFKTMTGDEPKKTGNGASVPTPTPPVPLTP